MVLAAKLTPLATERWTRLQLLFVAACARINALDGMDVLIIAIVALAIAVSWGIGFAALGIIFSAGLLSMMIGCVVIAPLAGRFGRRPLVLAGLILITLGMIGSGLARDVAMLAEHLGEPA